MRRWIIGLLVVMVYASTVQAADRDADSVRKWREDISYFQRELPRRHPNLFHNLSQRDFESQVRALNDRVPSLRDDEIVVGLAGIIASLGPRDGHSRVNLRSPAAGVHMLPVGFYLYTDGLFVRAAAKDYASIVGERVVSIGGTPAETAVAAVKTVTSFDNEMSRKSFAMDMMSMTEVLRGLRVVEGEAAEPVTIVVEDARGTRSSVAIAPVTSLDAITWVDVRDAHPMLYRRFAARNPLGRHATEKNFWFDYDEVSHLLYVNFSGVVDMPDETVEAFFKRVYAFADAHPVKKFVLDIRNNGGGNNYLNRPILYGLIQRAETIGHEGTFFTIIGRETFSAAQNLANALEMHTNTIFVGEPTGGAPNSYGDALPVILPNSKLSVLVASVWWQDQDPRHLRLWIAPSIAAEASSADDRSGRDPALEAIRNYAPDTSLTQQVRTALANGERGKAEAAIRAWRADPRHKFLTGEGSLNRLGAGYYGENRPDLSVIVFELNAALNSDSWLAHNSLGRAYAASGKKDVARAEFERALAIRPNAPETLSAIDRLATSH